MTVIVNNKLHIKDNYKEPTDEKFDDCTSKILKNLGAENSSDSGYSVEDNMMLRHVPITVIRLQLDFYY